ncbi:RICIN domain-containing protein [Solwaraspora sp. WMMD937]|uniref:RICIN domain-containing protein n=1 Tax=Solwaraspora sp. WMMD937 TaxID=3016090 RepID=UPI00249AF99B|nr:RICIN domain-containing protein [Solwaraspora sp. WMMD937]WFE23921.1 RICIN domain-containing protein [Solwaraspora sp. WMMD937]
MTHGQLPDKAGRVMTPRLLLAAALAAALSSPTWSPQLMAQAGTPATATGATTVSAAATAIEPQSTSRPDLSMSNRVRGGVDGLPDWSRVGYQGGHPLPGEHLITADAACRLDPSRLAGEFGVVADDGLDDTAGLQAAIDHVRAACSPSANFHKLSLINLPAGRIDVSRQIYVDANFLTLRGQGSGAGGTQVVFRPDTDTRYDTLSTDGSRWDPNGMSYGSGNDIGKGGWIWPGRALFKVQTREVASRYQNEWQSAPTNRKDLFEGSVNQHWVSGQKLASRSDDPGFSARSGQSVIHLASNTNMSKFSPGGYIWVGAANSVNFYEQQGVTYAEHASMMENLHMRQQMFRVTRVDSSAKTITLDRPLEYDLPVDSISDGSPPLPAGTTFASKVTPLTAVEGVGLENFAFTQEMTGLPKLGGGTYALDPADAVHNYGNLAPEYAMNGVLFKWAANSWVRGLTGTMTGSHPIVTEVARNLQIEDNTFDGAWNKGKGGNGYLRGSRVWNSLYAYNTSRNLRHFTFQWSASGNVVFRNDFDSDLNLHGGWERYNLFEDNTVRVPYEHSSGSCTANCGGEGGQVDEGTWYPIWWAAGPKAIKWSGSAGPQNVFYHNELSKQLTPGGPYTTYEPYSVTGTTNPSETVYHFGSDPAHPRQFRHLSAAGSVIPDWSGRETLDYTSGQGVVAVTGHRQPSLFLTNVGQLDPRFEEVRQAATWNMQGAGTSGGWSGQDGEYEDKYANGVLPLAVTGGATVIALQEAGAPPPSAGPPTDHQQADFQRANGTFPPVREYRHGGTARRPQGYLYWLHTDTSANGPGRVNLAIATRSQVPADGIFVVASPMGGRPALGVNVGGTVFFTVHGFSGNGNDMPGLLGAIRQRMLTAGPGNQPLDWVAMGDFNRDPDSLANALPAGQFRVHAPPSPTHPTADPQRYLDYAVVPDAGNIPRITGSETLSQVLLSDHLPARFRLVLEAAADPPELVAQPTPPGNAVLRNAGTTNVADIDPFRIGNAILDIPFHSGSQQPWWLDESTEFPSYYRLVHPVTRNFMGQEGGAADASVVQWPHEAADQLWRPDYQGDGTWTLRNMVTRQMLTAVPGARSVAGRDWDGSAEQRWFFQTTQSMSDLREINHFPPLQQTDLVVDIAGGGTANGTPAILHAENDGDNQRFSVIPAGQTDGQNCSYLVNSGGYLSAAPTGVSVDGAAVALHHFRGNTDGYLWCESQQSMSMTLANRTVVAGVPQDLYLSDHGVGNQLTVEQGDPQLIQTWLWEAAS